MSLEPEPVYGEISQFENGLTPAGLAPASSCSFSRERYCVFLLLALPAPSCNCFSAMAKSAYHDARPPPFLTSITDLASVIGDYFGDYCVRDHKDYLQGGLLGSRYVVNKFD